MDGEGKNGELWTVMLGGSEGDCMGTMVVELETWIARTHKDEINQ